MRGRMTRTNRDRPGLDVGATAPSPCLWVVFEPPTAEDQGHDASVVGQWGLVGHLGNRKSGGGLRSFFRLPLRCIWTSKYVVHLHNPFAADFATTHVLRAVRWLLRARAVCGGG